MVRIDHSGRRYGHWTVVGSREDYATKADGSRYKSPSYIVRCDCGTERRAPFCNISNGTSRSCGCVLSPNAKHRFKSRGPDHAATNQVLNYYRVNAAKRGIKWALSRARALALLSGPCAYCDAVNSMRSVKAKSVRLYNGIDRMDPTRSYTADNCVSCCKACNCAKASMTVSEFRSWVARVYRKLGGETTPAQSSLT